MSAVVHNLFEAGEIAPNWLKSELAKSPRSQADLGRWMGVSQSAVCRMCSGQRKISLSDARDINAYLDATRGRLPSNAPKSGVAAPTSDVVIQAQHEIEVYENSAGSIVVKMAAGGAFAEDQMVVIRPEHIDAVVAALLRVKGEAHR